MTIDAFGRIVSSQKAYDHVGNLIPDVENSESIRPHGKWQPAAWLPVQFFEKNTEEYFVMLPGKPVALDNDGRLVPAGLAVSTATVVYTATDVAASVLDVRTGLPLLIGAVGTVTLTDVDGTPGFMGRAGIALAVSAHVAVCPYPYFQWAGDSSALDDGFNPIGYRRQNFNLQHKVAVLTDYTLKLPLVPAQTAAEAVAEASFSGSVSVLDPLSALPMALVTMRTPLTFGDETAGAQDAATRFVTKVDSVAEVVAAGDFHVDLVTGIISVYAAAALDPGAGEDIYNVTYSNYASAPTGSAVSKFACVLGDPQPGEFLKVNVDSNLVVANPASDNFTLIVGQVLGVHESIDEALGMVRTQWDPAIGTDAAGAYPAYTGQMDQMPGSATGGAPGLLHYAGGADKMVIVNLIMR